GGNNQGVIAVIGAACASWNAGVVVGVVLESQIQRRIVARRLQQERQGHAHVVDAVGTPDHRIVVDFIGDAQARGEVTPDGLEQIRRISRSEEHTSELQSLAYLVCRLLLEKKNNQQ